MAGLTREGFTTSTNEEILGRISNRLYAFNPTIDLSTESPDGQLVEIFSFEVSQLWSELSNVYHSFNPNAAVGEGLRNIGMLTGLAYGAATRSQVDVQLGGVAGTRIPAGSLVSDAEGNQFSTTFEVLLPATVQVVAKVSGGIAVDVGSIVNVVSSITGWNSVANSQAGKVGAPAQTEAQYRNLRNKTVLRNFKSVKDVIKARLFENLGIEQVSVQNNDSVDTPLEDGTPPQTIHVTVGELESGVSDEDIARVILATKGLGCPTYGTTTVSVQDSQGVPNDVSFSKAVPVTVFMDIEILFLDDDYAGAEDAIKEDLLTHINSLDADEDVIWSRLFGVITPYAKAQVNKLELSSDGVTYAASNLIIGQNEYAYSELGNLNIVVVN